MSAPLDGVALALLDALSPSGALREVASGNAQVDALLAEIDADEEAIRRLQDRSLVTRLEDDFARAVPEIEVVVPQAETYLLPLLTAVPGAPLVSLGVQLAVKVALLALDAWSKRRLAQG